MNSYLLEGETRRGCVTEVIFIRRIAPVRAEEAHEPIETPEPSPAVRRRWPGLRGAVEGQFRTFGRVFTDDQLRHCRGEWRQT